jgi:calcineurin-like phosphoesterase family protein
MAVWFISDMHIGHGTVAKLRGYDLPGDHDDCLAQNWDRAVRPNDQVWVLGDISSGAGSAQHNALRWVSERPGIKHLIAGNHDGVAPLYRDSYKWMRPYMRVFESVAHAARRRICGIEVLLSHYPYSGDHVENERFSQWRLPDYGTPILHGHTHRTYTTSLSDLETPQIHVGVDAWGQTPVSMDTLHETIKEMKV